MMYYHVNVMRNGDLFEVLTTTDASEARSEAASEARKLSKYDRQRGDKVYIIANRFESLEAAEALERGEEYGDGDSIPFCDTYGKDGEILEALREADKNALRWPGMEYRVYIDTDGEIGCEEWTSGDNGRYVFRDPDYKRFYIHTFCHEFFSVLWDWYFQDESEFRLAFRERFGFELPEDEDGRGLDDLGRTACEEHGVEGYREWLNECEDQAIELYTDDEDYSAILDLFEA